MKLYNSPRLIPAEEFIPHEPGRFHVHLWTDRVSFCPYRKSPQLYLMEDILEKFLRYDG